MSAINKPFTDPAIYFPGDVTLKILSSFDESEKGICAGVSTVWYKLVETSERNELHKGVTDVFELMKAEGYPVAFKEWLHTEIKSTKHGAFKNLTEKFAVKYYFNFPLSTSRLLKAKNFEKIDLPPKSKAIFQKNLRVILAADTAIDNCNKKKQLDALDALYLMTITKTTLRDSILLCTSLNLMDELMILFEKNDLSTVGGEYTFLVMYRTLLNEQVDVDFMLALANKQKNSDYKKYVLLDAYMELRDSKNQEWYKMMQVGARVVWWEAKAPVLTGLLLGAISGVQRCPGLLTCSSSHYFLFTSLGFAVGAAYGIGKGLNNLLDKKLR